MAWRMNAKLWGNKFCSLFGFQGRSSIHLFTYVERRSFCNWFLIDVSKHLLTNIFQNDGISSILIFEMNISTRNNKTWNTGSSLSIFLTHCASKEAVRPTSAGANGAVCTWRQMVASCRSNEVWLLLVLHREYSIESQYHDQNAHLHCVSRPSTGCTCGGAAHDQYAPPALHYQFSQSCSNVVTLIVREPCWHLRTSQER